VTETVILGPRAHQAQAAAPVALENRDPSGVLAVEVHEAPVRRRDERPGAVRDVELALERQLAARGVPPQDDHAAVGPDVELVAVRAQAHWADAHQIRRARPPADVLEEPRLHVARPYRHARLIVRERRRDINEAPVGRNLDSLSAAVVVREQRELTGLRVAAEREHVSCVDDVRRVPVRRDRQLVRSLEGQIGRRVRGARAGRDRDHERER
jgi:hypothetical protein